MPPAARPRNRPTAASATARSRWRRFLWPVLGGVVCLALVAAVFAHLRTESVRAVAARGVAPRPDLRGWPAPLAAELDAAESAVFAGRRPAQGLMRLSALYHANGFYPEAQQAYRTLRELQPREPKWPHRAAHLHATLGESQPALDLWRQALEITPDYTPAQIGFAEACLKSNRSADAAHAFSAVLARSPQDPHARLGLARIALAKEDWAVAQAQLEAVARQTDGLLGADLLATVYERAGAPERAVALRAKQKSHGVYVAVADPWIDELMDACFDTYRLALESGTATLRKDFVRAEHLINRALELSPDDANLNFHAGQQARQRGNLPAARRHLETAVQLDPRLTDAWAVLFLVLQQQGLTVNAAQTLGRALALNADSPVLILERARLHKAEGRSDAAMADFRRVTRLRHDDATAFIELGRLLLMQNRLEDGIEVLRQGLVAEPGHPIALSILAFAAIEAGRQDLAASALREIVEHPRVTTAERARLLAAYQRKFSRAYTWTQ